MDVIIQKKRRKALSVTYGDSSPRGRAKAAFSIGPDRTEGFPIKTRNVPICHSDRSASGVEESTTLEKEPPQDKTINLGSFLDSHSLPRNDMSVGGSGSQHGLYLPRAERDTGRSLHPLPDGYI